MRDEISGQKSAFFGLPLDTRRRAQVCADISQTVGQGAGSESRDCFRHHSLNASKLPAALRYDRLFAALSRADCLSADGMGIVWAARLMGIRVSERVTGIDLMTDLLTQFAQDGTRVFLLGARQEVLDQLKVTLPRHYPGLIIAGTQHGYEMDDDKLAACVARAKPDALFVALPSPRKELFVDQYAPQTGCRFAMGVGGAFDVLAGKVRRAPTFWQRLGLEFLWRILCQPRYMIPRYARGLGAFAKLVLPRIAGFQFRRFRIALRRAMIAVVALAVLVTVFPVSQLQAQPVTSLSFDPDNRQGAISWIETEIAKLKDQGDVTQLIDALTNGVLSPDGRAEQPVIDWQAAESSLQLLLGLLDTVVAGGTSRFLFETILGGVVLRLMELHPDPERIVRVVRSDATGLAERLFERPSNRPIAVAEAQSAFSANIEGGAPSRFVVAADGGEARKERRYTSLFAGGVRNPQANRLWGVRDYEDSTGITELEDGSPR